MCFSNSPHQKLTIKRNGMKIAAAIKKTAVNKSGKVNIKIRVSHNDGTRFISTKYYIDKSEWRVNGTVSDVNPNSAYINNEIKKLIFNYEQKLFSVKCENFHINRIVELLTDPAAVNDFTAYFNRYIKEKKGINAGTAELYQRTLNKIEKFDSRKPLMFEDINAGWLKKFEAWMVKDDLKINSISIPLRQIRAVFNNAIDNDIIPLTVYPFRRFKIARGTTVKRSITLEQLKMIQDFQTKWKITELARDFFMLSFYLIGMNSDDLYHAKAISADGRLIYDRAKTHRNYSVKVEPEAMAIIEKYKGENNLLMLSEHYKTVHAMTHSFNVALKRILPSLEVYTARRTWATIAKNNIYKTNSTVEVSKEDTTKNITVTTKEHVIVSTEEIGDALGHTRKTVSEGYIAYRDPAIVDKLNRAVIDCLK